MEMLTATGAVRGVFFNNAKKTAHIAIYSLTEPNTVNAMIAANKRGIKVAAVADNTESKNAVMAAMIKKLTQAGIDVRLAVKQKALVHNKVGIFDGQTIYTASCNWTNNARKNNDENLPVVDGADLAVDYEKYVFRRILKNETLVRPD